MKPSQLVLAALLLAALCAPALSQNSNLPSECCFNYYPKRIFKRLVVKYELTRKDCSKKGVIFTSMKGFRICADPRIDWVKQVISYLDEKLL
uniref:C-C motif chemokine n=2 Tax=Lepisosteus oculatus TaxID=7918 RepID=W5MVN6_LEPOC